MPLTLDSQTEQRIQKETEAGHYASADDFLNHAIDALHGHAYTAPEDRNYIRKRLEQAWEEFERGEGIPGERIEEMIAERRLKRAS